jgi:hypothetical protein
LEEGVADHSFQTIKNEPHKGGAVHKGTHIRRVWTVGRQLAYGSTGSEKAEWGKGKKSFGIQHFITITDTKQTIKSEYQHISTGIKQIKEEKEVKKDWPRLARTSNDNGNRIENRNHRGGEPRKQVRWRGPRSRLRKQQPERKPNLEEESTDVHKKTVISLETKENEHQLACFHRDLR